MLAQHTGRSGQSGLTQRSNPPKAPPP